MYHREYEYDVYVANTSGCYRSKRKVRVEFLDSCLKSWEIDVCGVGFSRIDLLAQQAGSKDESDIDLREHQLGRACEASPPSTRSRSRSRIGGVNPNPRS
jgi:hypothetical protein